VFSFIDQQGRYAYQNQPRIAHWNLAQLAQALLPLIDADVETAINYAQDVINSYLERFEQAYLAGMRAKLGLFEARDGDITLVTDLLDCMAKNMADYTLTFRRLSELSVIKTEGNIEQDDSVRDLFEDPAVFDSWAVTWRQRLTEEASEDSKRRTAMRKVNPAFIPRNHLVEAVIQAAVKDEDFEPFEELVTLLAKPYNDQPAYQKYAIPPKPDEIVQQTFCGT